MTHRPVGHRAALWRHYIVGRTVATSLLLVLLVVLNGLPPPRALWPLLTLVALQVATNGAYLYVWRIGDLVFLGYLAFGAETLLITVLIHLFGADGWVFALAYLWPIVVGGLLIGRRAIPWLTLLAGLCIASLILAQRAGLVPAVRLTAPDGTPQALVLAYPYLAFVALLVWLVVGEVERRDADLQDERNLLSAILAHLHDAVVLADGEERVALANEAAGAMLGVRAGDALPGWLAADGGRSHVEHAGRTLAVRASPLPASGTAGTPEGAHLVVVTDRTEEVEAERFRADLVGYASHELRTPLASIKVLVRLLLMDAAPGSHEHEHLARIDAQLTRQMHLVNDLLDYTRLEARRGGLGLAREEVAPEDLLEAVRATCAPLAAEGGLALDVRGAGGVGPFAGNAAGLERVLVNLAANAIHCTPAGGRVSVECLREGDEVLWVVADTGVGMGPEVLERLFTRGYTARGGPPGMAGTGLGLALAKAIVEELGGRIEVQSEVGRGSRFTVRLPASPEGALSLRDQERSGIKT